MRTLKSFWLKVKRNPVISAFLLAVVVQFLQDYRANQIDWAHFAGYATTMLCAVAARQFTVPASEVNGDAERR